MQDLDSIRDTAAQQLLGLARRAMLHTARVQRASLDITQAGCSLHRLHDQPPNCHTQPRTLQQQRERQQQQQEDSRSNQAHMPVRAAGEVPKPPPAATASGEALSSQEETNSPRANANGHGIGSGDVAVAAAASNEGVAEVQVKAGAQVDEQVEERLIRGIFGDASDPATWQREDAAPFAELCYDADFWGCLPVTAGVSDTEAFGREPLGEGSMKLGWTRRVVQGRRGREDVTWGYQQDVQLAERILVGRPGAPDTRRAPLGLCLEVYADPYLAAIWQYVWPHTLEYLYP